MFCISCETLKQVDQIPISDWLLKLKISCDFFYSLKLLKLEADYQQKSLYESEGSTCFSSDVSLKANSRQIIVQQLSADNALKI